jgi:transcriptional regulator with XRE-family HTH domain
MDTLASRGEGGAARLHPLRAARLSRGLTIEQAAEGTRLSESTIKRLEAGKAGHPHTIRRLADYYRRSPAALGLLPYGRVEAGPATLALPAGAEEDMQRRDALGVLTTATGGAVLRPAGGAGSDSLLLADTWTSEQTAAVLASLDAGTPDPGAVRRLVHEWLLAEPPQVVELRAGRRIGEGLVRAVEGRVEQLRRMDDFVGGGDLHGLVAAELRATLALLRDAAYPEALGRRLLTAVGELSQLAGWVADDADLHALARRYYTAGVRAAHAAGNAPLGANLISTLSYQLANTGDPREAVALAHTAAAGARHAASATTLALFRERIAWAHARAGDARGAERALGEADRLFGHRRPEDDPVWVYWLSRDEMDVMAGRCATELRQPKRAEALLRPVLARYDEALAREAALYASWFAEDYVQLRELEEAAAVATRSLLLSARVNSARGRDRVALVRDELRRHPDVRAVRDFEDLYRQVAA